MTEQNLSPEVADAISDWVEDTLANVECSIEHGAAVTCIVFEEDRVSIPFTYKAAGVMIKGAVQFDNMDFFTEIIGHYAAECEDDELLEQMISIAKGKATKDYLELLREGE